MTRTVNAGPGAPGTQSQGGVGTAPVSVDRGQGGRRVRAARLHQGKVILRRLLQGWGHDGERTARCGYRLGSPDAGETWTLRNGRAEHVGRETCASTKLCAVCHDAAALVRAAVVSVAVWRWLEADEDRAAVFVSITPGHRAGDRLDLAHDRLMEAREAVMCPQRAVWRRFRRDFGVADVLWVVEHTVGMNGPHAQLHAVFLLERAWEAEDVDRADAALWMLFRAELDRLGHTGGWSASRAIDIRPVTDGPGLAAYLAKIGLGAEVTGLGGKDGRGEGSVAYLAIPARLAELCGARSPVKMAQVDPEVRRLVDAMREYADLVYSHRERGRRWFKNFAQVRKLVPELGELEAEGLTGARLAAALLELLPVEVRPLIGVGGEDVGPFDDDGVDAEPPAGPESGVLHVDADSWQAASEAWWHGRGCPPGWWTVLAGLLPGVTSWGRIDLAIVVGWMMEDRGIEAAADAVASLAGAHAVEDDIGWSVTWPGTYQTVRTDRESPGQSTAPSPYRAVREPSQHTGGYGKTANNQVSKGGGGSFS